MTKFAIFWMLVLFKTQIGNDLKNYVFYVFMHVDKINVCIVMMKPAIRILLVGQKPYPGVTTDN